MPSVSFSELRPLIYALEDGSPYVRLAALRALVRLRIEEEVWYDIGRIVLEMLERSAEAHQRPYLASNEIPLYELITAAGYVPLGFVQEKAEWLGKTLLNIRPTISYYDPHFEWYEEIFQFQSPPFDPALSKLAEEVTKDFEERGYFDDSLAPSLRADLIPYLPQAIASRLVSRLFREAVQYPFVFDHVLSGNEIVRGIAQLREPFQPEFEYLFYCYVELWRSAAVIQDESWEWSLRWLIAWTVSRAKPGEIIAGLQNVLTKGHSEERELAARLIDDSARYANQHAPPQFGGGTAPPDIHPGLMHSRVEWESYEVPLGGGEYPNVDSDSPMRTDVPSASEADMEPVPDSDVAPDKRAEEFEQPSTEGAAPEFYPGTLGAGDTETPPNYLDEIEELDVTETPDEGETEPEETKRVVNTGFAPRDNPAAEISPDQPLAPDTKYFFWLDVGLKREKSAEVTPSGIPQAVPGVSLAVTLIGFEGGMQVTKHADVGELYVQSNGSFKATKQPLGKDAPKFAGLHSKLLFPVRTPSNRGIAIMRCNIYHGQILLQSRLVQVNVATAGKAEYGFRSVLDYKLSQQLDPGPMIELEPHRMSILLNNNNDGTHSFHFFGADENTTFKHDDVRFNEGQLTGLIKIARGTLRLASWGNKEEWKEGINYKYKDRKLDLNRLRNDLTNLARWGYEFYSRIIDTLAGNPEKVEALEQLMLKPGLVQIAMKESPSYVLPAALIYDYAIDTGAEKYTLCSVFEKALAEKTPLSDVACFHGECPSRGKLTEICPSGFWGFRHQLGMPLSLEKAPDIEPRIKVSGDLNVAVGVATDMQLLATHKQSMEKLSPRLKLVYAETRDMVFEILTKSPHLVYFYCHGGFARDEDGPFLQVGPKEHPGLILQSNFRARKIVWKMPRPLVFINGCHTTSLEPQQALEFISPLVTYCQSVGVIGTEITIFEELASAFAEECFRRFCKDECIGEAIRQARLALLSEGNPLGLVYIPFVGADLRVEYEAA